MRNQSTSFRELELYIMYHILMLLKNAPEMKYKITVHIFKKTHS